MNNNPEKEQAVVYISKYALTVGVFKETVDVCGDLVLWGTHKSAYKGEWWRNKEDAIKKAEEMRQKKIASLKKKITKLENLKFE